MSDQLPPAPQPVLSDAPVLGDPIVWQPNRTVVPPSWPMPPLMTAMGRGLLGLCPACGQTHVFNGYLRVVPECTNCGAPLGRYRADDAPPYFTIFIVGHLLIPFLYWFEVGYDMSLGWLAALFLPLAGVMTLVLLRPVKGATVGLMLKLGMVKPDDD